MFKVLGGIGRSVPLYNGKAQIHSQDQRNVWLAEEF